MLMPKKVKHRKQFKGRMKGTNPGGTELNFSYESGAENPVTFLDVSQLAAERLFSQLPGTVADAS